MLEAIAFYSLAILMVLSALAVILARQPITAVLALVLALFMMAGLFILLGAFFVAAIQILVYAGAIMVLFLFVVMLLDLTPETIRRTRQNTLRVLGAAFGIAFIVKLIQALDSLRSSPLDLHAAMRYGTTQEIGKLLFTTYALPFEVASVLVLVGIVGAVVLAKRTLG